MMRDMLKAMLLLLYLWSLQEGAQTKQFRVLWQVSSVLWQLHISISRENFMIFTKNTIYVNALDSFSIWIKVIYFYTSVFESIFMVNIVMLTDKAFVTNTYWRAFSSWYVAAVICIKLMIYVYNLFVCLLFMHMMPNLFERLPCLWRK